MFAHPLWNVVRSVIVEYGDESVAGIVHLIGDQEHEYIEILGHCLTCEHADLPTPLGDLLDLALLPWYKEN